MAAAEGLGKTEEEVQELKEIMHDDAILDYTDFKENLDITDI